MSPNAVLQVASWNTGMRHPQTKGEKRTAGQTMSGQAHVPQCCDGIRREAAEVGAPRGSFLAAKQHMGDQEAGEDEEHLHAVPPIEPGNRRTREVEGHDECDADAT